MQNNINDAFTNGISFKLVNRGPKNSGITYELKNIFEQMEKAGILKDKNQNGLSSKDALSMFNALNKIHKETGRSTDYTHMRENSSFSYTADEIKLLAEAAGYEIQSENIPAQETNPEEKVDNTVDDTVDNNSQQPVRPQSKPSESAAPQEEVRQNNTKGQTTEFGDDTADYEGMSLEQKMIALKENDIKDIVGIDKKAKLPDNFEVKILNKNNSPEAAYFLDGKEIKGQELNDYIEKLKAANQKQPDVPVQEEKPQNVAKTRKERRAERRATRKGYNQPAQEPRTRGAIFKSEGQPDRIAYTYKDFVGQPKDISQMSRKDIIKLDDGELVTVNNSDFIKEGDKLVRRGETNKAYAGDVYYTTESYSMTPDGKPDKLVKVSDPLGETFTEYKYDKNGKKISEIKQNNKGEILQTRDFHAGYNIVDGKFKEIIGADKTVQKIQQFNQYTGMWEDVDKITEQKPQQIATEPKAPPGKDETKTEEPPVEQKVKETKNKRTKNKSKTLTQEQISKIQVKVSDLKYEFKDGKLQMNGTVSHEYGQNDIVDMTRTPIKQNKKTGKYTVGDKEFENYNTAVKAKSTFINDISMRHAVYMDLLNKQKNGTSLNEDETKFMKDFETNISEFYNSTK